MHGQRFVSLQQRVDAALPGVASVAAQRRRFGFNGLVSPRQGFLLLVQQRYVQCSHLAAGKWNPGRNVERVDCHGANMEQRHTKEYHAKLTRDAVALTFCRALIDGVNERKRPIIGFIAAHKVIQSVGQLAALDDKFRSSYNFNCFNEVIEN